MEGAPGAAALLFALSFFAVSGAGFWDSVCGYARPFSPMLLLIAFAGGKETRLWWFALPCALLDLRISIQLGPQLLGLFGIRMNLL